MRCIRPRWCQRGILFAACLALTLAGGAGAAHAAEPTPDASAGAEAQAAGSSAEDLERAAAALAEAQARSAAADAAYSRMRHSNRPRGAAREAIVRERTEARKALLEVQERYEALQRGARGHR
jgi:hypothetical protein